MTDDAELRALREQVQALKARQASFRLATVVEPLPSTPVGYVRVQVPGPGLAPNVEMDLPHPENFLPEIGAEVTLGMSGHTPFVTAQRGTTIGFADPAGNVLATVDPPGRAQFTALSSVQWPQIGAADWTGKGGRLDEILDRRPRDLAGYGVGAPSGSSASPATTTTTGWFEVSVVLYPGRLYKVTLSPARVLSTVAGDTLQVNVRASTNDNLTEPAVPTITSPPLFESPIVTAGQLVAMTALISVAVPSIYRLLVTYTRISGTGAVRVEGAMTLLVEDVGPQRNALQVFNNGTVAPAAPPPSRKTVVVSATWTRTYRGDGTERTGLTDAGQGYTNLSGLQRSLIGFPAIPELVGATVETVSVYLHNRFWREPSGGTAVIGTHGLSAAPATLGATPAQDLLRVPDWPRSGGKWVPLPLNQGWATGTLRGIQLGATTLPEDPVFDGRFVGALDPDATRRPQLSITYVI